MDEKATLKTWFSGQSMRKFREATAAYLMVAPALILIFTFGIFPVLFAVYVSLHKWKIKQSDFLGLANYVKAIDTFAYILFFALALGFAAFAYRAFKGALEHNEDMEGKRHWILAFPAALHASAAILFLRWGVLLLPEVLAIADLIRRIPNDERNTKMYMGLFSDAAQVETVAAAFTQWILIFSVAWIVTLPIWRGVKLPRKNDFLADLVNSWLFSAGSFIVIRFTYIEIEKAILLAQEVGEEVAIWVQIITIFSGVILLFFAWKLWQGAVKADTNRGFIFRAFAAIFFVIGGWLLIGEIPAVIQAGDKDLWLGLRVTVYYAMGTIPFQLSISLVLAFLLFQNIRGKEFFRILFFLPYITPAVASAAVFSALFSQSPRGFANQLLGAMGIEAQRWLLESRGIFQLMADSAGWVNFPEWAGGPSQALVVIIIYSIWVYVGYDVVIYMAGLGNIPKEVYEAAAIDGADRWQVLRHITLPLLSPTIYFLSLIAVIGTFKAFNHIFIMRNDLALGTVDTFSVAIFDEFFIKSRFGYASAMAFVLFAVILSLTYINNKVQGSRVFYG